jgi:hypothetical protein
MTNHCRACGAERGAGTRFCRRCGQPFDGQDELVATVRSTPGRRGGSVVLTAGAALAVVALVLGALALTRSDTDGAGPVAATGGPGVTTSTTAPRTTAPQTTAPRTTGARTTAPRTTLPRTTVPRTPPPVTVASETSSGTTATTGAAPGSADDVVVAPGASAHPLTAPVVDLVTRYIESVNTKDFATYRSLFTAAVRDTLDETSLAEGYRSTRDSDVQLLRLGDSGDGRTAAQLSFTSTQDAVDGPDGQTCTDWRITLFLEPEAGRLAIGVAPSSYRAQYEAC